MSTMGKVSSEIKLDTNKVFPLKILAVQETNQLDSSILDGGYNLINFGEFLMSFENILHLDFIPDRL